MGIKSGFRLKLYYMKPTLQAATQPLIGHCITLEAIFSKSVMII